MAFSKSFAKNIPGTNYPVWEEIFLTPEEEKQVEERCKQENSILMDECLREAKHLVIKNGVNNDNNIVALATALFDKRASHVIFWKENKAKEKFEEGNKK
jgi:membrane glycosyltransferase